MKQMTIEFTTPKAGRIKTVNLDDAAYNEIRHSPCFFCNNLSVSENGWHCHGDKFSVGKWERKLETRWPIMLICSEVDFHALPRPQNDVDYFVLSQSALFIDRAAIIKTTKGL